jgi:hypothetical protein
LQASPHINHAKARSHRAHTLSVIFSSSRKQALKYFDTKSLCCHNGTSST